MPDPLVVMVSVLSSVSVTAGAAGAACLLAASWMWLRASRLPLPPVKFDDVWGSRKALDVLARRIDRRSQLNARAAAFMAGAVVLQVLSVATYVALRSNFSASCVP